MSHESKVGFRDRRRQRHLALARKLVLFGGAYFGCAEGSMLLHAQGSPNASFWLPGGLYVAVLLLNEYRIWPWLILAATLPNILFDTLQKTPAFLTCTFILANTVEAAGGAWLVRRFVGKYPSMQTLKEYAGFLFFGALVGPFLGSLVSLAGQHLSGFSNSWVDPIFSWIGSTGMATLIVSPFVLSWFPKDGWRPHFRMPAWRWLEAVALFLSVTWMAWFLLVQGDGINAPAKSPIIILAVWAGLRFGVPGATALLLYFSLLAGYWTEHYLVGLTPAEISGHTYAWTLQSTLFNLAAIGMVPAVVLAEHEKTRENLRRSQERFQLAVRGSSDGIWDRNLITGEVFYSDRYRDLLGYSRQEFPDTFDSFLSVMHPDDKEQILRAAKAHVEHRIPYDVEYRLRTKPGIYRWFRARGAAIWDEAGKPVRLAGAITDITVEKLQSQLLRENEEKFSKAFHSNPNSMAITVMATGQCLEVNDSFCALFGAARDEMLGRSTIEFGLFKDAAARAEFFAPVLTTGHLPGTEISFRSRSGDYKTVVVAAERIELGGVECVVLEIVDITARLQTERRLEETGRQLRALTRRLQSLREEERTRLAREIHDHLGQLLTALNLELRLIDRRAGSVADAETRAALQTKINSARQLADETITSVQKIATELRPAILDRVGLEAAIEAETQAFRARTGLACECTIPSEPLPIAADQATAVFRIFQEILTNVARHAKASRLVVHLSREDHHLELNVRDNGVGMDATAGTKATSLGLMGMKERAAILGGKISFTGNEDRGTSVVVRIPLGAPTEAPA